MARTLEKIETIFSLKENRVEKIKRLGPGGSWLGMKTIHQQGLCNQENPRGYGIFDAKEGTVLDLLESWNPHRDILNVLWMESRRAFAFIAQGDRHLNFANDRTGKLEKRIDLKTFPHDIFQTSNGNILVSSSSKLMCVHRSGRVLMNYTANCDFKGFSHLKFLSQRDEDSVYCVNLSDVVRDNETSFYYEWNVSNKSFHKREFLDAHSKPIRMDLEDFDIEFMSIESAQTLKDGSFLIIYHCMRKICPSTALDRIFMLFRYNPVTKEYVFLKHAKNSYVYDVVETEENILVGLSSRKKMGEDKHTMFLNFWNAKEGDLIFEKECEQKYAYVVALDNHKIGLGVVKKENNGARNSEMCSYSFDFNPTPNGLCSDPRNEKDSIKNT